MAWPKGKKNVAVSIANSNRIQSKEEKEKRANSARGRKHSDETKRKMSDSAKGNKNSKGRVMSLENKQKLIAAVKGIPSKLRGRKLSDETKRKMSESMKIKWANEDGSRRERLVNFNKNNWKDNKYRNKHLERILNLASDNTKFISGYYESVKAGIVVYRSSYELRFYKLLDLCSDVVTYEVEPYFIPYTYNNVERTYVPDVLIYYVDGSEQVIEIKPSRFIENDEIKAKLLAGYSMFGDSFCIVTEKELQLMERSFYE